MSNTKKIALMSTLVLLLAATAICNFVLAGTGNQTVTGGAAVQANYFSTFRAERNTTRSEEFVQLDAVLSAYEAGTEEHTAAAARKQELVEIMEDELVMESIIKALGFSDAGVVIGESGNINVFINSAELNKDMAIRIATALQTEHDIRSGNIIIMPIYAES